MENETFKDIKGFEGHYEVSNLGRVKSLKSNKEIILNPGINKRGYLNVCLHRDRKQSTKSVHLLVAVAFLGHNPNIANKIVIDHINNNPLNNNVNNLQLITNRENCSKDQFRKNRSSKYIGVCWYKKSNKWDASIRIGTKRKHLGYFHNELEAAKAYIKALKENS